MNSRPLLDYLAFPDRHVEAAPTERGLADRPDAFNPATFDALEARLADLAARLRTNVPSAPRQDQPLSAQIDAILKRKMPQADEAHSMRSPAETAGRRDRMVIDPPPSIPALAANPAVDPEFAKFSEAVYLIGQAARRFIDEPEAMSGPTRRPQPAVPSASEIDALSAVLRETVSSFRSVADDLAVSAGEIRNFATHGADIRQPSRNPVREEREVISELNETMSAFRSIARELAASVGEIRAASRHDERASPARRDPRDRFRDDEDEIHDLRETVNDLQDRLDTLLHARRRTRY